MNQKGFINIIRVIIIVALVGAGVYFVSTRQNTPPTPSPSPTPTPILGVPTSGPITVGGVLTCLPKTGQGAQTEECAIGLKGIDGRYYGLKNLLKLDPGDKFSTTGLRVEVSGTFLPEEILGPAGAKYDVVGTIDVTSIKKVEGSAKSSTWTVQPEDPNKAGLAPYPDLSITSLPTESV